MEVAQEMFVAQTIETMRQLTLQLMLLSAGVFGVVGGFVSAADKCFLQKGVLAAALGLFAASVLFGYLLHGVMISLLNAGGFDANHALLIWLGLLQIGSFVLGGTAFIFFVIKNVGR